MDGMSSEPHRTESLPAGVPAWFQPCPEIVALRERLRLNLQSPWGPPGWEACVLLNSRPAKLYPERSLFPIAARGDCDDLACVERGRPGIVVIHPDARSGKEEVRYYPSVAEFQAAVEQEVSDIRASEHPHDRPASPS